jgi:hypothetical protein
MKRHADSCAQSIRVASSPRLTVARMKPGWLISSSSLHPASSSDAESSAKALATRSDESWKKSRSSLYRVELGEKWSAAPPAR